LAKSHSSSTCAFTFRKSWTTVTVCGDGQCLFRCAAIIANDDLLKCSRDQCGVPLNAAFKLSEEKTARKLRDDVVDVIEANSANLEQMQLPYLLEGDLGGQNYSSMQNRIACMRSSTEYAGNLEIIALACCMRIQICIYSRLDGENCLVAKIPVDCDDWPKLHLAHQLDTKQRAGHFDLLVSGDHCTIPHTTDNTGYDFVQLVRQVSGCSFSSGLPQISTKQSGSVGISSESQSAQSANQQKRKAQSHHGVKLIDADKFPWLVNVEKDKAGKRCVKCVICAEFAATAKALSRSHHIPPMAVGCRYNAKVVIEHSTSTIHQAAVDPKAQKSRFDEGNARYQYSRDY